MPFQKQNKMRSTFWERDCPTVIGSVLASFKRKLFVGWHLGQQTLAGIFEMARTGILPQHQNRGLYTALLPTILEQLKHDGFQIVSSRHNLTNNAVIVPKLKAGFVISGFEVDDRFGTLVQLFVLFQPTPP